MPGHRRSPLTAAVAAGARLRDRRPGFEGLEVYSVDDRSVQVQWEASAGGRLRFGVGEQVVEVDASPPATDARPGRHLQPLSALPGGPGAVVVEGLRPDEVVGLWAASSAGRVALGTLRTLPTPTGSLLAQVATITDIHLGEVSFGPSRMEERWPALGAGGYSWRAAGAAAEEAVAWGATHLVVKGDLTRDSEPGEFEAVGRLLAGLPVGSDVVLGNHDVRHGVDGAAILARHGIDARPTTRWRDVGGVRIVLAHSPTARDHWGVISEAELDRIADAVGSAPGPCILVAHHAPLTGAVTTHYPPGMRAATSTGLLRRLAASNRSTVVVAGHTHRNRLRWARGILCIETGSTKDHPGGWTGYRVYEGGIVQTARRTARPDVLAWTEATRRALGRQWGRWSAGILADRSWSLDWPTPTSAARPQITT